MARKTDDGVLLVEEARKKFDQICEQARTTIYGKVTEHFRAHPNSPWSGSPLVDLEKTIRAFYDDLRIELDGEFRDSLPDVMKHFYDRAASDMKAAGLRNAILGKPDTARIKHFLDSAYTQVAMKTEKMMFENIKALRNIASDVFRTMSVTGAARKEVSAAMLDRALKIKGFEFIDKAGTKWELQSYFSTLARTELMNAGRETYADKCTDDGYDVMLLSVSGNPCPACARFEGRLFSLTGSTPGLPTKEYLKAAGVFHPNCTHSFSAVPAFIIETEYDNHGLPNNK
ncbi:MAG: phage minor capsid protein [Victivallaceae bacterium]